MDGFLLTTNFRALQRLGVGLPPARAGQEILRRLENTGGKVMRMENEKFQEIVVEHLTRLSQTDAEMNDRLKNLEATVLRIENDHGEKILTLMDAHEVQLEVKEKVDRVVDALQRIEGKVDLRRSSQKSP